jgi:para-nitrobenzyl esterase
MIRPAKYLAEQMPKVGSNGYVFNFSYVPEAVRSMTHGAWHGAEINYIFDTLNDRCREHGAPTSEDKAMSRRIRQYWINFAREGAPGTVDGVEWKPAGQGTLVFSKQGAQFSSDYLETRMKAIGSLMNARSS